MTCFHLYSSGGGRGGEGSMRPGRHCAFGGAKYGILKSGHFWRIGVHIAYDMRCYFNVRSKADISQLNLPHLIYLQNGFGGKFALRNYTPNLA